MPPDVNNLIWIDLEMTGLIPERDRVIEIATIVTDAHLNTPAEGPVIAIHQSDATLAAMDEWNTRQHTGSGLVERIRSSDTDERAAETATLEFLRGMCRLALRQCAVTAFARIGVLWRAGCRNWKRTFTIAIWM